MFGHDPWQGGYFEMVFYSADKFLLQKSRQDRFSGPHHRLFHFSCYKFITVTDHCIGYQFLRGFLYTISGFNLFHPEVLKSRLDKRWN
jgi:hypothetical protein